MSAITETFNSDALPDLSPFEVLWEQTSNIVKEGKNGAVYEQKVVVVRSAKYPNNLFGITLPRAIYQTMRIQSLTGIKRFTATHGVRNEKGYAPLIVSGVPA